MMISENKSFCKRTLPLLLIVFTIFTVSLSDNLQIADAVSATIDSYVANDPDDLDTVFGAGDTLTINTDIATNATVAVVTDPLFVTGNFTFNVDPFVGLTFGAGNDWTAEWTSDQILEITFINIGANVPVVGVSTVDPSAGNTIGDGADSDTKMASGAADTLSGDFGLFVALTPVKKGGGGCSGDCENPTLGVNDHGRRLVDNGFSYNGNPINVEHFFTPYPLVTTTVGMPNLAEFKIYENMGPDAVWHFELAFGLGKGESIDKNQALIIWDKTFDGIETTELEDPYNVLENVRVVTSEVYCQEDSKQMCLSVKVYHKFRAPLEFNVLGTNVWDAKRNAMQNYYNHGIEVEGENMNPRLTKEIPGSYKNEGLIEVAQSELYSNLYVAQDGRVFEFFGPNNSFRLINSDMIVREDSGSMRDRYHSSFNEWQEFQAELATSIFDSSDIQGLDPSYFAYDYPDVDSRTQFLIENGLLDIIR